jgi:hypothetical protein
LALGSAATLGPFSIDGAAPQIEIHGTEIIRVRTETVKSSMSIFSMDKIAKDRMISMDKVLAYSSRTVGIRHRAACRRYESELHNRQDADDLVGT